MTPFRIAFITVPNADVANTIADGLVQEGLAACVNIVPGIRSVYRWQGKICTDDELLLICKTDDAVWPAFCSWVQSHHPYDVPEIIQVPITQGAPSYLEWIAASLAK